MGIGSGEGTGESHNELSISHVCEVMLERGSLFEGVEVRAVSMSVCNAVNSGAGSSFTPIKVCSDES